MKIIIKRPCWVCKKEHDVEDMTLMFATAPGQGRRYMCDTCRFPKKKDK